jgi:hypothetical protein
MILQLLFAVVVCLALYYYAFMKGKKSVGKPAPIVIVISNRPAELSIDHTDGGRVKPVYHAQIQDEPGYWASGYSLKDAVGNLVLSHKERFNIEEAVLAKSDK